MRVVPYATTVSLCGVWWWGLGCGNVSTPYPADGAPNSAIVELAVTLPTPVLSWPITAQATAMAMYDDGTTRDVTASAMWSSSNVSVATVDAGVIASQSGGIAVIQAALGDFQADAAVTVRMPTLAVLSYDDDLAGNIAGIDFFPADARGNVAPLRSIRGDATKLEFRPYGMTVHGQELFIDCGDYVAGICVFPTSGNGNVAPKRRIAGNLTTLRSTIAFTVSDTELVAAGIDRVVVFGKDGNGNIPPERKIAGKATTLKDPLSAILVGDEIFVADYLSQAVAVFPASASGNVPPVRKMGGSGTPFGNPTSIYAADGELYVIVGGNSIRVYPISGSGNEAPVRTIQGLKTKLQGAHTLTSLGELLFVANQDTVLVFKTTDTGNTAPQYILGGPATRIKRPTGVAVF